MVRKASISGSKIPSGYKKQVTKKDRISRKQLTQGLKKSLGTGKRISVASKYLKKEGESLLSKRSFNRQQVSKRLTTLKEGGFLKRGIRVVSASRKLHTTAAARNRMEKKIEKNLGVRKKEYQQEARAKQDEKEWQIEQEQKERAIERKQERIQEKDQQDELIQSRLARAAQRRKELGLGDDLAARRIKGSMKTDKNTILAEIRGETKSSEASTDRLSQVQKQSGKIGNGNRSTPSTIGENTEGSGWSVPPSNTKKGL